MKKLTLSILIITILLTFKLIGQEKVNKNTRTFFEVKGVCIMCKKRIEKASLKVKGIKMATWDIPSNIISVIYDPGKVEIMLLHQMIADIGHDTPLKKSTEHIYNSLPKCCLYNKQKVH